MQLFCLFNALLVKPLQQFSASYQQKKDNHMLLNGSFFLFVICLPPEFQTRR